MLWMIGTALILLAFPPALAGGGPTVVSCNRVLLAELEVFSGESKAFIEVSKFDTENHFSRQKSHQRAADSKIQEIVRSFSHPELTPAQNLDVRHVLARFESEFRLEGRQVLATYFQGRYEKLKFQAESRSMTPEIFFERLMMELESRLTELERKAQAPRIDITTDRQGLPRPSREELGELLGRARSMQDLETQFDMIARRASAKANAIHEVDMAFLQQGIPDQLGLLAPHGQVEFKDRGPNDKAFALNFREALNFEGALSNMGHERHYALLLPHGFIKKYGADLRGKTDHIPGSAAFARGFDGLISADKVFVVRREGTRDQLHVQMGWKNVSIDGRVTDIQRFFDRDVLAVIEFGADGKILGFELINREP